MELRQEELGELKHTYFFPLLQQNTLILGKHEETLPWPHTISH